MDITIGPVATTFCKNINKRRVFVANQSFSESKEAYFADLPDQLQKRLHLEQKAQCAMKQEW